MTASVNEWYSHFLSRRSVPLKRDPGASLISEGFVVRISQLHLTKLSPNARYRIRAYFFDAKNAQLFGWPYNSPWKTPQRNDCEVDEEFFFHCARIDDSIQLILEVLEDLNNGLPISCAAWAIMPIGATHQTLPEFGKTPPELRPTRLRLHPGTTKVLMFTTKFDPETTSLGAIECILYTHPRLQEAFDFFPEFFIVGAKEHIPGLRISDGVQLENPIPCPHVPAVVDGITLSFSSHAKKIEQIIVEELNNDRLYVDNLNAKAAQHSMMILERRLRIGVHNSFTFLFEPIIVHLSSFDESVSGTHSLRRKSRALSRSSTDIISDMNNLFVRTGVSLPKLYDDHRIVVVFALDYLLGVRNIHTNTHSTTQSVIVGWGAWSPFHDRSVLQQGTVRASVPLIGGARPNPEEVLCFKNFLHIHRRDDSVFTAMAPRITIDFVFSLEDNLKIDTRASSSGFHEEDRRQQTPAPRKDIIPPPSTPAEEPRTTTAREPSPRVPSALDMPSEELKLPPIVKKPTPLPTTVVNEKITQLLEADDSPRDGLPYVFEVPWKETKASNISRSALSFLSKINFAKLLYRNGHVPPLVDGVVSQNIDMNIELNDRLSTNEIILQFLAFKQLSREFDPSKLFFSFQFYRFPEVITEQLFLDRPNNSDPSVLRRTVPDNNSPGFMAKFIVDRQITRSSKSEEFTDFLRYQQLFIDVWDADSLIMIGTAVVPFRSMLRGGNEAVQTILQCPVVFSSLANVKNINGLLYLKLANIGHPFSNQIEIVHSRNDAIVARRLKSFPDEEGINSYRIIARPLSSPHESAIHRFIQAQRIDIQQRYEDIFNEDSQERIEQWNKLKTTVPASVQKTAFKRFIFQEQLEAYRTMRNESKAAKLLQAVFRGITLTHTIHPCPGEKLFFEFLLQNTFPEPINCVINIDEPALSIVDNLEEWSFYKRCNNLTTAAEPNLFRMVTPDRAEVFLKPMEAIYVPFLYDEFKARKDANGRFDENKILFRRWDSGEPISILDLRIQPRAQTVSQSFRFYNERGTQCTRYVAIEKIPNDARIGMVRCSDPTVKSLVRNAGARQQVSFSVFSGDTGAARGFYMMLYSDIYGYRLVATWKIVVHSLDRIDVRTTYGQSAPMTLTFNRPEPTNQLVELRSNYSHIDLPGPLLSANQLVQVQAQFTPEFTGRRSFIVTAIDTSNRTLLYAWLICARVDQATISRRFQLNIDINEGEILNKAIPLVNLYSIPIRFRLTTNRSDLITISKDIVELKPEQTVATQIFFHKVISQPVTIPILLFVHNADTGATEETISLSVTYSE